LLFLGLLVYLGVHRKVIEALDQRGRASRPSSTMRAAARGGAGAPAEFERKGREAENEAAAIIAGAKAEAERLAAEAKTRMEEFVARRTKMAEAKIARPRRRRSPTCAPPRPMPQSPQPRKFSPPPPRASSPRICSTQGIEDVRKKFN
jgi:F-type H+-transporting ATPase subunit b